MNFCEATISGHNAAASAKSPSTFAARIVRGLHEHGTHDKAAALGCRCLSTFLGESESSNASALLKAGGLEAVVTVMGKHMQRHLDADTTTGVRSDSAARLPQLSELRPWERVITLGAIVLSDFLTSRAAADEAARRAVACGGLEAMLTALQHPSESLLLVALNALKHLSAQPSGIGAMCTLPVATGVLAVMQRHRECASFVGDCCIVLMRMCDTGWELKATDASQLPVLRRLVEQVFGSDARLGPIPSFGPCFPPLRFLLRSRCALMLPQGAMLRNPPLSPALCMSGRQLNPPAERPPGVAGVRCTAPAH